MLTKRQNFLETIHGGKPDRFVNQYEFLSLLFCVDPVDRASPPFPPQGGEIVNGWGITIQWAADQPGAFPLHDEKHTVIKDIIKWKDVIKSPRVDYPPEDWADAVKMAQAVDRNETFVTAAYFNGVFEKLHFLMGMDACFINLYAEPGAMKELIAYVTDYELRYAEAVTRYIKPDALFHHDDWGSHTSLFISPEMFREFLLPAYKQIYGFYKSHGVEIIVHHSDSYAADLVPMMIEMGVDVFQGCTTTNNVPELVKKYGEKISFMGDLDSGVLDKEDWTPELVRSEVERACRNNGKYYFIPCLVQGLNLSTYPGVYDAVSAEIDRMSKEMF
jgi:hypothetical protein